MLGTSYNADNFANSIGFPTDEMETVENPPGPTITTVADFRKVIEGSFEKHHVIEDFSIPCNAAKVYRTGLAFAAVKIGTKEYPLYEEFEKTMQVPYNLVLLKTLSTYRSRLNTSYTAPSPHLSLLSLNSSIGIYFEQFKLFKT